MAEWTQTDAFGEDVGLVDIEDAAAFGDDARGRSRVERAIVAEFVCAAEDAIVCARDRIY